MSDCCHGYRVHAAATDPRLRLSHLIFREITPRGFKEWKLGSCTAQHRNGSTCTAPILVLQASTRFRYVQGELTAIAVSVFADRWTRNTGASQPRHHRVKELSRLSFHTAVQAAKQYRSQSCRRPCHSVVSSYTCSWNVRETLEKVTQCE